MIRLIDNRVNAELNSLFVTCLANPDYWLESGNQGYTYIFTTKMYDLRPPRDIYIYIYLYCIAIIINLDVH